MLSHVIPQCLVTDRIPIKLQLTGKSRLIYKFFSASLTETEMVLIHFIMSEWHLIENQPLLREI